MPKVLQTGGALVKHHLVILKEGVDLIDGGFWGGVTRIKHALHAHGKTFADVRCLLLTHGHLDHTLNLAELKRLTSCTIHAPLADRAHLEGTHRYRGWSRVAGWLQRIGRFILRYEIPEVDHWFKPGDTIHGYEVIGLPGHTTGHCGFLLGAEKLLFAGDLFSNQSGKPAIPPRIFNDDHEGARQSIRKVSRMSINGIVLNHTSNQSSAENQRDLQQLARHLS